MANFSKISKGVVKGKQLGKELAEDVGEIFGKKRPEIGKESAEGILGAAKKGDAILGGADAPPSPLRKATDDLMNESPDGLPTPKKKAMDDSLSVEPSAAGKEGLLDASDLDKADKDFFAGSKSMTGRQKMAAGAAGAAALGAGAYMFGRGPDGEELPNISSPAEQKKKEEKAGKSVPAIPKSALVQAPSAEHVKAAYADLQLPDQGEDYDEMQKEFVRDLNAAQSIYEGSKNNLESRELWEKIIHGVGLMAAGAYGYNNGVDVSGVKFDPTDWNAKREAARADLKMAIDNAAQKNNITKEKLNRIYDRNKDQIKINQDAINAAEERDKFNADLKDRKASRDQDRDLKLAELKVKAQESGDEKLSNEVKSFQQLEKDLDNDFLKYAGNKEGESEGTRQALIAKTVAYEEAANALGIPKSERRITVEDLQDTSPEINAANRAKRVTAPYRGSEETKPSGQDTRAVKTSPEYRQRLQDAINSGKLPPDKKAQYEKALKVLDSQVPGK